MTSIEFLELSDILEIHADQIFHYGGTIELRDAGILESAHNQICTTKFARRGPCPLHPIVSRPLRLGSTNPWLCCPSQTSLYSHSIDSSRQASCSQSSNGSSSPPQTSSPQKPDHQDASLVPQFAVETVFPMIFCAYRHRLH